MSNYFSNVLERETSGRRIDQQLSLGIPPIQRVDSLLQDHIAHT